jgi:hypothetical protein
MSCFYVAPRLTDGERIMRVNRLTEFVTDRKINRRTHPRTWQAEHDVLLAALLAFEMQEGAVPSGAPR